MTQYDDRVQYQRDLLKAEEWAKTPASVHVHSTNSMWYDTRPQDTKKSSVTDTIYNSGLVIRTKKGKHLHTFGKELTGEELVRSFIRHQSS